MAEEKQIWNYQLEEITQGYIEEKEQYRCILCGKSYFKGTIYPITNQLFDAYGAVKQHVKQEHGTIAEYLLNSDLSLTGISEVQQQLLTLMSEGKDDKEIANKMGIAQSTVRNHRFKLREKEKQAKLYLAMLGSLEEKINSGIGMTDRGKIEEIHPTAKMVDNRFIITEQEKTKTIETYMTKEGTLSQFPAKEKKKIIVLGEIMKSFQTGREYSEQEVNQILKRIYSDYPTIRRALIEYGFMERSLDCMTYVPKV